MKRVPHEALCHRCALGACLAISACTTAPPSVVEPPATVVTNSKARLAQRGHGAEAAFALCRGDACPHPTLKTLGTAPRMVAPVARDPALVAPIPLLESIGPDEQLELQPDPAAASSEKTPDTQATPAPP